MFDFFFLSFSKWYNLFIVEMLNHNYYILKILNRLNYRWFFLYNKLYYKKCKSWRWLWESLLIYVDDVIWNGKKKIERIKRG